MREIRPSGSEGGVGHTPYPYPYQSDCRRTFRRFLRLAFCD